MIQIGTLGPGVFALNDRLLKDFKVQKLGGPHIADWRFKPFDNRRQPP